MTTSEEIKAILGRIAEHKETKADMKQLKQVIESDDVMKFQLGETLVNIGEGKEIYIGDKVIQQFELETLREILKEKKASKIRVSFLLGVMSLLLGTSYIVYNQWQHEIQTQRIQDQRESQLNQWQVSESKAKNTIDSIIQAQRDFFVTHNQFAESATELNLLIDLDSENYKYEIRNFYNLQTNVAVTATPKHNNLRSFVGVITHWRHFTSEIPVLGDTSDMKTLICQTTKPSLALPNIYIMTREWDYNRRLVCPPESQEATVTN
ncbi:MAG: type IV pilin-like G/H family protein [Microcoleaceae cyanobacterium]